MTDIDDDRTYCARCLYPLEMAGCDIEVCDHCGSVIDSDAKWIDREGYVERAAADAEEYAQAQRDGLIRPMGLTSDGE